MKKRASSLIFTPAVGARVPIRPSLLRISLLFLFLRLLSALVSCWITCTACTDTHTRWRHVHLSRQHVTAGRQRRARGKQPDLLQRGDLGHHLLALSHLSLQSVKQLPHLRPTLLLQRVMIETLRTDKNRKSSGNHDDNQQRLVSATSAAGCQADNHLHCEDASPLGSFSTSCHFVYFLLGGLGDMDKIFYQDHFI